MQILILAALLAMAKALMEEAIAMEGNSTLGELHELIASAEAIEFDVGNLTIKEVPCGQDVSPTEMERIFSSNLKDLSETAKCFLNCYMEQEGLIRNGTMQTQAFEEKFQDVYIPEEYKMLKKKCLPIKEANACDTAAKVLLCIHEIQDVMTDANILAEAFAKNSNLTLELFG